MMELLLFSCDGFRWSLALVRGARYWSSLHEDDEDDSGSCSNANAAVTVVVVTVDGDDGFVDAEHGFGAEGHHF
jgi:hypothetical protein